MNKRNLMNKPVLILNGDGQPLSRYPFSVNSMKKVLKSLIKGRVSVVKESSNEEDYVIIKGEKLQLPQIVMINKYINVSHIPKFSRKKMEDIYEYLEYKFSVLELFVRTIKNWRDKERYLQEFGFKDFE